MSGKHVGGLGDLGYDSGDGGEGFVIYVAADRICVVLDRMLPIPDRICCDPGQDLF